MSAYDSKYEGSFRLANVILFEAGSAHVIFGVAKLAAGVDKSSDFSRSIANDTYKHTSYSYV